MTVLDCIQNIVNISALPDEIEKAKPNGNLDTVFNKYCDKRNQAIECVEQFTDSLDPCLNEEEKQQKQIFSNITKRLLEFVCHENGNQIACKDLLANFLKFLVDDVLLQCSSLRRVPNVSPKSKKLSKAA
jgi:Protein of unknown function (DUF1397)